MKYGYGLSIEPVDFDELEDVDASSAPVKALSYVFQAICTSEACAGNKNGVKKNVARSVDECPDCGDYLFWDKQAVA